MYKAFCNQTGSRMPDAPAFNADWRDVNHPIVNVNWSDAKAYCHWVGVTLPTEAQWEKAARGTNGITYPWGNEFDDRQLWGSTGVNRVGTTAVGRLAVSPYGCTDMAGNALQWCYDWFGSAETLSRGTSSNPKGPMGGQNRVLRGGCWLHTHEAQFRASSRFGERPDASNSISSFRCASNPK